MVQIPYDFEDVLYCPLCGRTLRRYYPSEFPEIPYKSCSCGFLISKSTSVTDKENTDDAIR